MRMLLQSIMVNHMQCDVCGELNNISLELKGHIIKNIILYFWISYKYLLFFGSNDLSTNITSNKMKNFFGKYVCHLG